MDYGVHGFAVYGSYRPRIHNTQLAGADNHRKHDRSLSQFAIPPILVPVDVMGISYIMHDEEGYYGNRPDRVGHPNDLELLHEAY